MAAEPAEQVHMPDVRHVSRSREKDLQSGFTALRSTIWSRAFIQIRADVVPQVALVTCYPVFIGNGYQRALVKSMKLDSANVVIDLLCAKFF